MNEEIRKLTVRLYDSKKPGDILVVAIKNDDYVSQKGVGRPIICQEQRAEIIDNLKCVDYVVITNKCDKYLSVESLNSNDKKNSLMVRTFLSYI